MQTDSPPQQEQPVVTPPAKGLLMNRNFRLLAVGMAISNIGDFLYSTTLLVWVFALSHSAAAISGVLLSQYIPIFLFGPIAGVFVDRWHRRQTMVIAGLICAFVAVLPLLAPTSLRLLTIYSSVFLISTLSRFSQPAQSGVTQVIVSSEQQGQAASINQATFALAMVIGPAIASPLYFALGPLVAVLINAASFVIAALCIQSVRASKEALHPYAFATTRSETQGLAAIGRELLDGFRFILTTRVLLMVVIMALIAMFGSGALNALDIIFVSHRLHLSTAYYGPFAAIGGIGALIGAIVAGLLSKKVKPQQMLTVSVLLCGIGLVFYSFQTWYVLALVMNFLAMVPQGGIDVGFGPLLINNTPQQMIGRATSVIQTCMMGASLLSISLAGYLGQSLPVNIIFLGSGILIAFSGLFGWFVVPRTS